jgi:hypothetical protein
VPVGADIARDLGDLLVRDVEAVVALEGEEEVVARDAGDRLRLEPVELPDAVIFVHDVVACPQVGEALERPPDADVGARRALAEDLRVGEQDQIEVTQHEAAAGRRDREDEAGAVRQLVALVEHDGLEPAEQAPRPHRLAAVDEGHDDLVPAADVGKEVALGLGQPARGDRGPLRLERVWLTGRQL